MKFSKGLIAVVALCALSTISVVTPSAYLKRAKAAAEKAKESYLQSQDENDTSIDASSTEQQEKEEEEINEEDHNQNLATE